MVALSLEGGAVERAKQFPRLRLGEPLAEAGSLQEDVANADDLRILAGTEASRPGFTDQFLLRSSAR
jgi:hypothetical protein